MIKQSNNSIVYTAIFAVIISFIIGCGGDDEPPTLSTRLPTDRSRKLLDLC